jgi:hypothetical protein
MAKSNELKPLLLGVVYFCGENTTVSNFQAYDILSLTVVHSSCLTEHLCAKD